ncbi:MAG: hypothetical protein ACR2JC_20915 [Chloroflexota bacterium]
MKRAMPAAAKREKRRSRFSTREQRDLRCLRSRYQRDADVLSDVERARLRFIRWLHTIASAET